MPTPEVKTMPEVRDYPKTHFRAILRNPNIATTKESLDKASKVTRQQFYDEVLPVVKKHCSNIISLDEFKKKKIIHRNVVKVLFEKLL